MAIINTSVNRDRDLDDRKNTTATQTLTATQNPTATHNPTATGDDNPVRDSESRSSQDTIVHETVPGEDPILEAGSPRQKEKAATSTMDEDTN